MNKALKYVLIVSGVILLVILLGIFALQIVFPHSLGSLGISRGVILRADNGSCLMIKGSTPIVLSSKDGEMLQKLSTGDEVLVLHDGVEESYPARTGAYLCIKLSSGSEIDPDVLAALAELGWVKADSLSIIAHSVQYIRTDGSYPKPGYVVIHSTNELNEYYQNNRDSFYLERRDTAYADTTGGFLDACDRYDEAFFEDNIIIIAIISEPSGSIRHELAELYRENDELVIVINRIEPESGTCDMACWHILIELSRNSVAQCSTVRLELEQEQ